jgi:hypothetical protein
MSYSSNERQRDGDNWPRPFGLRCKWVHTSLSALLVGPPQASAFVSSGPIFTCNAPHRSSVNRLLSELIR